MRSRRPPNCPCAASRPEIPLNTLRSARLNVKTPSSGVRPGSSLAHGPNVPWVVMAPGGTALSSVASNGIAVPVETLDIRRSWMSQIFGAFPVSFGIIVNLAAVENSRSTTNVRAASTGAPLPFPAGLSRGGDRAGVVAIAIGRNLNVETVDVDPGDVPVKKAHHPAFRGEMRNRNERRHVAPAPVTDGQAPALGA